jgi:uncharacterized membrane protein
MSKMLVVVFDEEKKAFEASRALIELHREGSITAYSGAIIARDAEGQISVKDDVDEGPIGTALGMMTGALIGMFAGPEGAVMGAALGSLMGATADLINLGVGGDFVDEVSAELEPGKVAVVAEIGESWTTPVDLRMEDLGGTVIRRNRVDVEDEQIEREIAANKAEWEEFKSELKASNDENKARLKAKADAAKTKLEASGDRAKVKLALLKSEAKAKEEALEKQLEKAKAENREKLEERKAELQEDYAKRSKKLKKAWKKATKDL